MQPLELTPHTTPSPTHQVFLQVVFKMLFFIVTSNDNYLKVNIYRKETVQEIQLG